MNKKQLIDALAITADCTKKEAAEQLSAVISTITTAVTLGSEVSIPGFGSFKPTLQKGKSGKVPGTDKTYTTADKMVPRFKAGKAFKEAVASCK